MRVNMSFNVLMHYRSGMPAAVIYPGEKVEIRRTELLDELKLSGICMGWEHFRQYKDILKNYSFSCYILPPDDKASKEVQSIFAKVFVENEVPTLLRSGYYMRGPEALEEVTTDSLYKSYLDSMAQQQAEKLSKTTLSSQ